MDESTTRGLLARVLAEAPPPAPVDLDQVIGLAEAYRRRRAHWVVATAAALVLVITVAVAALATGAGSERAAPPASRPSAENARPGTAPTQFDPAHSSLQVGGAPATLTERGTAVRTTSIVYYATSRSIASLQAVVGAKGHLLQDPKAFKDSKVVAGPVIHGHASKWYDLGHERYLLRWQWAPDAEAYVSLEETPDPLAVATRVASSMRVDLSTPTRLPFTLRSPSGFQLMEFETATSSITSPAATVAFGGPGKSFVSVNANRLGSGIGIGKPNTTYQGRPARITVQSNTEGVNNTFISVVMAFADLKVTGTCNHQPNTTITAAQLKALCLATTASVQRVADLRTPATWPVFAPR